MSQALYRQYRPQRFEDVVGQDVAVRTLRNAIEQDRVAHAYLFTGTKGTGKTTLAKLLAKAMNCEQGPTSSPCGTCAECVAIAEGRSLDVVEIDAASNTGIDDVRDKILDTAAFQPSSGTRRVYILDEAHQLSKHAFNALLKTIEEPPPHVVFVFCTTETHLMMATIRDRCQRVTMRSPGPDSLLDVLHVVCASEGLTVEDDALRAVARAAQGSFRNALGTLEMLTTTFGTTFTRDEVLQHLGIVAEETLFEAGDALVDGDAGAMLLLVERLVQDGVDIDQFARSLADHLRTLLLQRLDVSVLGMTGDPERLAAQAARASEPRLLGAIDCISDALTRMRVGSDPRISLETALVRACTDLGLPMLAARLAALGQGGAVAPATASAQGSGAAGPSSAPAPAAATPPARPAPARAAAHAPSTSSRPPAAPTPPTPRAATPPARPAPAAPPRELSDAELGRVEEWWPDVVKQLATVPAHRPFLTQLEPARADTTRVVLRAATTIVVSDRLQSAVVAAVRAATGRPLTVQIDVAAAASKPAPAASKPEPAAAPPPPRPPAATPAPAPAAGPTSDDAGVRNLMTMFDASPVDERPAATDER